MIYNKPKRGPNPGTDLPLKKVTLLLDDDTLRLMAVLHGSNKKSPAVRSIVRRLAEVEGVKIFS